MDKIIKTVKSLCDSDEFGITYNELLILIAIKKGHSSLKDICKFLLVDKGLTFRILGALLSREIVSKGGRFNTAVYTLTEKGESILKEAYDIQDFIVKVDFNELSKETHDTFKTILKKYEEKLVSQYFAP